VSEHDERRDEEPRPPDPAGTQRRHDPASLLPTRRPFDPPLPEVVQPRERPALGAVAAAGPPPADAPARRGSRYARRFRVLTAGLAVLALVAVGALAAVALDGDGRPGRQAWSAWSPTAQGLDGAEQIAAHVGARYRMDGTQLVQVRARELEYRDTEMDVVLRESEAQGGDISLAEGDGVLFELCGLGPACSIERGKPSNERGLLLSREALELALYALRYLEGVEQVLVQFPARPGEQPMRMLRFTRDGLKHLLDRPLSASLAPRTPGLENVTLSPDAPLVGRMATTNVFLYQLRDGGLPDRLLLVLDPYSEDEEERRQQAAAQERLQLLRQASGAAPSDDAHGGG
jgi:hypothetical protein